MGEKIDTFCENLRRDLTDAEERLSRLKSSLDTFVNEDEAAFEAKKVEARDKLEEMRQKIEHKSQELKDRAAKVKEEAANKISEWKQSREQGKLEARAEDACDYARAAMEAAVLAIDEARSAALAFTPWLGTSSVAAFGPEQTSRSDLAAPKQPVGGRRPSDDIKSDRPA